MISLIPFIVAAPLAIVDVAVEVGDGTRLDKATVIVDGAVIAAVGPGLPVPLGAARVDGTGKVLSPGLFATGSQLGLFEIGLEASSEDASLDGAATPAFRAGDGYSPLSTHIPADREEGVTTALLSPAARTLISGQGFVVELRSTLDALPDLKKPAALFGAFDGGVAQAFGGSRGGLMLALREIVDDARFYRFHKTAFDKGQSRPLRLSRLHLEALFPVLDGKIPFVVHVDRASDILAVLAFCQERRIRLVIDGGAESWLVADRLWAANVPVIVHPSTAGEKGFDALHARDDLAAVLHRAGVTVVIGSWGSENGTTRLRQEAGIAVQNGLPHAAAVQAITQTPATLFGGGPVLTGGVVKKGARANLVLWSGDPLEALTLAERVWVAGVEPSTPSRQRQLAERYRPRLTSTTTSRAPAAAATAR